jgi:hypothetical protein
MKQQQWKAGLIVALLVAMTGSVVLAGAGTAAPAPAKEPASAAPAPAKPATAAPAAPAPAKHEELLWPDLWKTLHSPTPWLSMGMDVRLRLETGQNWDTLNDDSASHNWEYERYRLRWWTKWVLGEDISFNTRLVWEPRSYSNPPAQPINTSPEPTSFQKFDENMNWDEALFDWFNINVRNIAGLPLTATIGRQDMIFGVGWLVLDASPLDGSRTIGMFDAARFTYDWADAKTKIDLVYINRMAESDAFLEPICDKNRALTEQDENGAIVYLTNTSFKPTQLEAYFMYKNDNPTDRFLSLTNLAPFWGTKQEIFTFGGAISGTPAEHWKYRAEAALQAGTTHDRLHTPPFAVGEEQDILAWGTLSNLEYLFKDAHENAVHVGYELDSGDDPHSKSQNEQFNLLWGEWPRWSELLIYTWTMETEPANTTNLHRANIGHRINLTKKWSLSTDYHALWSDQPGMPWRTGPNGLNTDGGSKFRGSLVTSWLRYKFSDQLYGHFLGEYFWPGNYYIATSKDDAWFFRFNVEYVF